MKRRNILATIFCLVGIYGVGMIFVYVLDKPDIIIKNIVQTGRWTMHSEGPAQLWRDAFVTGNGRQGTMVMGRPGVETITCVHEELFLSAWDRDIKAEADVAYLLPKVRKMIREGKSKEAAEFAVSTAREKLLAKGVSDGWPVLPHPAFDLMIDMGESKEPSEYHRQLNLETGITLSRWSDAKNNVEQRVFTSRVHNVNVIELRSVGEQKLNLNLELKETPGRGNRQCRNIELGNAFNAINIDAKPGWLYYHADYAVDKGGYEGLARISSKGGILKQEGTHLQIKDADKVLIVLKINPLDDGLLPQRSSLENELEELPKSYSELLAPHVEKHGEMFRRVKLDLGCKNQWQDTSIEELLSQIQSDGVNPLFLEMMHAMGRYLLISTSGKYPAPLQGIWGGSWRPRWGGSFTTDTNVNLAISSAAMGNLPECAESYFGFVERQLSGWRANARNTAGCRGFMMSINADPETGYATTYSWKFPFLYWSGGVGWNIRPFYDYGLLTGDQKFMNERVLPLYRELAQFYEDYLVEDKDGQYNIIPSISPENRPLNEPLGMAVENSTFDIAVARETFAVLLELGEKFNASSEELAKWKDLHDRLPAYRINKDGALAEWAPKRYEDQYDHRHSSHLYPIFPGMEFLQSDTDPALVKACSVALDKRYAFDTPSAHGLIHIALMATRLHDVEKVQANLDRFSRRQYISNGFVTSHNPNHDIYNLDASLSLPRLLMEMLVFSRSGYIELLPAWPEAYADGTINGVLIRGGHRIDISWVDGRLSSATLYAGFDDQCNVKYGSLEVSINLKAGEIYTLNGSLQVNKQDLMKSNK